MEKARNLSVFINALLTGDETNYFPYILIGVVCIALIVVVCLLGKRKDSDDESESVAEDSTTDSKDSNTL